MMHGKPVHAPPPPRSTRFRAPLGLLGALAFVACVERFVAKHDLDFTTAGPANWKYSAHEARRPAGPGGVLCFGTSLIKYGVVSRLLERETGRPAFNLAVCNGHMPSSYYLLRRAIEAGASPAAVVVDCQDSPVARNSKPTRAEAIRVNLRYWPELVTLGEALDLARTARDANFLTEMLLSWSLPSYKARLEIRGGVLTAVRGETSGARRDVLALKRNWQVNKGTMLMPLQARPAEPAAELPPPPSADDTLAALPEGQYRRNKLTDEYARRFVALAESRGIPVFWVMPPLAPAQQAERDRAGLTRYYNDQAKRLQDEFPNVTVVDARRGGYQADVFWDKVHLDRRGACVFTADLGAAVARRLAGGSSDGRWDVLPTFRERPANVRLEDVNESRVANALAGPPRQ